MKKLILHITFLSIAVGVSAQIDSVRLNKKYLKHYWTDSRDWITAPVRWQGDDWLKLGAAGVATLALITIDQPVNDFFRKNQDPVLNDISAALEPLGTYYALAAAGGLAVHGWLAQNHRSRSTGLLAAESFVLSTLLVRIPKIAAGRSRPNAWWNPDPYEWRGPFTGKSFPSGHTTSAFAVASVIAYQYRDTKWIPVTAYSLAGLAGLSRIYQNHHWTSDVFVGAIFGTATGLFVCNRHFQEQITLVPEITGEATGFKMILKW